METCRLRRHRPRPRVGNATLGRQEVGIPGILLRVGTSFCWPGEKLPDNRRGVDRTSTRTTHLGTYRSSAHCPHKYSHSPREHAWLKGYFGSDCALWCLLKDPVIPASCLTGCRTCHRTLLHDRSYPPHLFSDLLLLTESGTAAGVNVFVPLRLRSSPFGTT